MTISDRKDSHLEICLRDEVEFRAARSRGFASFRFEHDGLPEIGFDQIQLETRILGKRLSAPLIIGAMTGGTARTAEINRRLAAAAEELQIGIALGSQRKLLDSGCSRETLASYQLRRHSPGIPLLFGNLGAVQLNYGADAARIRALIADCDCDAFNFHLNPLQEAIQPEGDRNFARLLPRLRDCIPELSVPVFIKEVGAGLSARTARKLRTLPIQGVETAGVGGTSWAKIEGLRSDDPARRSRGSLFAGWGITTAESIQACRKELPDLTLIASGGIRNGIEVAKALALGAHGVALALPVLKAAEVSTEAAVETVRGIIEELRTALFVIGVSSIDELRNRGAELLLQVPDQNA